jgi:hypothetical protein
LYTTQLTACGTSISEFANYTLNSVPYNFAKPADSIILYKSGTAYTLWATRKSGNVTDEAYINFTASATGSAALNSAQVRANNKYWYLTNATTVSITEFGAVGTGYVAGNFNSKMVDTITNQTVPITYTFRVKRTQ